MEGRGWGVNKLNATMITGLLMYIKCSPDAFKEGHTWPQLLITDVFLRHLGWVSNYVAVGAHAQNVSFNFVCLSPRRTALTISIFIGRAFISGGFQVVYVYTPEV